MEFINYTPSFLNHYSHIFETLKERVVWDDRMRARKTASFGKAYNYCQISYPYQEFNPEIECIGKKIEERLHFRPNNCLINYYLDGNSKMGFHSDQTDNLHQETGVAIVSLGETRTLRFRNIADHCSINDFPLVAGSLLYIPNEIQKDWQHAIPKSDTKKGRMSLTFRKLL